MGVAPEELQMPCRSGSPQGVRGASPRPRAVDCPATGVTATTEVSNIITETARTRNPRSLIGKPPSRPQWHTILYGAVLTERWHRRCSRSRHRQQNGRGNRRAPRMPGPAPTCCRRSKPRVGYADSSRSERGRCWHMTPHAGWLYNSGFRLPGMTPRAGSSGRRSTRGRSTGTSTSRLCVGPFLASAEPVVASALHFVITSGYAEPLSMRLTEGENGDRFRTRHRYRWRTTSAWPNVYDSSSRDDAASPRRRCSAGWLSWCAGTCAARSTATSSWCVSDRTRMVVVLAR